MASTPRRYRFDEFQFDLDTGELTGPAGTVRLQPKPAAMLSILLSRPGELVTREEFQRQLWPGTQVEFDQGLNYCARQIRAALGEEAGEGGRIETLPRRGYRLKGDVQPLLEPASPRWLPWAALLLVFALVVVALAAWQVGGSKGKGTEGSTVAPARLPIRIAVLPLEDRGGDARSARVNELLTQALVAQLTAADPRLAVLGPATTGVYLGTDTAHTEIGRALQVDFVASGGYRIEEGQLFVQMVRTRDGEHVFAQRIESQKPPGDEVVQAIVSGIVRKLDDGDDGDRSNSANSRN